MDTKEYNELREMVRNEYAERFALLEKQYNKLQGDFLDIIKEVHHGLGADIATIEGLYNLELIEGTEFKFKSTFNLALKRARVRRVIFQEKFIDPFHVRDFEEERKNLHKKL